MHNKIMSNDQFDLLQKNSSVWAHDGWDDYPWVVDWLEERPAHKMRYISKLVQLHSRLSRMPYNAIVFLREVHLVREQQMHPDDDDDRHFYELFVVDTCQLRLDLLDARKLAIVAMLKGPIDVSSDRRLCLHQGGFIEACISPFL